GGNGQEISMATARAGAIHGRLEKATVRLLADEGRGKSLSFEGRSWFPRTGLVATSWDILVSSNTFVSPSIHVKDYSILAP
ncbi:MAG: hypothetical protein ACJ79M_24285, partial [Myxococcales bacterium]